MGVAIAEVMRRLPFLAFVVTLVGGTTAGCGGDAASSATCSGPPRSLSADVAPIIVSSCSGGEICHSAFGGPQLMHDQLVGVLPDREPTGCSPYPRVTPGDPRRSYLMNKLLGVGMCAGTARMPLGDPLPDADIEVVRDWICAGAPNN
jgi:hypothetical protein